MPRVLHGDGSRANPGRDMECTGLGRERVTGAGGRVVVTPSNPEPGARSPLSLLLPARCHRKPGDEAGHFALLLCLARPLRGHRLLTAVPSPRPAHGTGAPARAAR